MECQYLSCESPRTSLASDSDTGVVHDATVTPPSSSIEKSPSRPRTYSVKVINRKCKSEWSICKLRIPSQKFETLEKLKWQVGESLKDVVENPTKTIGYVEHGHGASGKQRWLTTDEDLSDMYEHFSKKDTEILLWCYSAQESRITSTDTDSTALGKKRQNSSDEPQSTSKRTTKYASHQEKMEELEEILEQLQEAHMDCYTSEQMRAWAHLIQMNKHDSYEEPPNKPFFRNKRKPKSAKNDDLSLSNSKTLSPSKHVAIQSQLIDQISKLHELLERGAISKEQYDKLQGKIMSDIEIF